MITNKELKCINRQYFNIIQKSGFAVTIQSKNTKHFWHIMLQSYPSFRSYKIYHKHNEIDYYHEHGHAPTLKEATNIIIKHDKFQLRGRKS